MSLTSPNLCFHHFEDSIQGIDVPQRFTYPFFYEPHALSLMACAQLQKHIGSQSEWKHEFGLNGYVEGVNVGKMFGVLVVEGPTKELGFLMAFSGKLAGENLLSGFVPPVADILVEKSFFKEGEQAIKEMTNEYEALLDSAEYVNTQSAWIELNTKAEKELSALKLEAKKAKRLRKVKRQSAVTEMDESSFQLLEDDLKKESVNFHFRLKDLNRKWKDELAKARVAVNAFEKQKESFKLRRREKSASIQKQIFDQYQFVNALGEYRSVLSLFKETTLGVPPSGAGDCAAPKLLQYAFLHGYKPLALAEFWWGQSPKSEIRKHGNFYPACKGKCFPILTHMLGGLQVEDSPLMTANTSDKKIEFLYEDEGLAVINKPHDLLSVPGKTNSDSVEERMRLRYPNATGPIMVHRLDRATSGLMLIAKTKEIHQHLQAQFVSKKIKKKYVALLEGELYEKGGEIKLPLRVDVDDRPRQLVCFDHGKFAHTRWELIRVKEGRSYVHLYPMTGRTHQLRVHMAHQEGLNIPIVGDDLYGQADERLCLHAAALSFEHPVTLEMMSFNAVEAF